jgi:rod shape determining protein RodA
MALLNPIRTRPRVDRRSTVWQVDWILVLGVVALSSIGALLIWSATHNRESLTEGNPHFFLLRHAMNFAIGLILAVGAAVTDHRRLRLLTPVLYAGAIVGLILVLVPGVGAVINGGRSTSRRRSRSPRSRSCW